MILAQYRQLRVEIQSSRFVQAREQCRPKTVRHTGVKVVAGRRLLPAQEAAEHLKVSKSRFYQLARADRVPTLRLGGRIYLDFDALGGLIAASTSEVALEVSRERRARRRLGASLSDAPPPLDDLYAEVTGKNRRK